MSKLVTLGVFALASCSFTRDDTRGSEGTVTEGSPLTSGSITLIAGGTKAGYDFSAGTYQGLSNGDFYFSGGKFWANNSGQRGLVKVGACASNNDVGSIPLTGYSTQGVSVVSNTCYVARTHNDERDHIVFRTGNVTSTSAPITWRLVAGTNFGTTFVIDGGLKDGYDFSTRKYVGASNGDFYYGAGAFWANNGGQRGVIAAGPCTSIDDVKEIPSADFKVGSPSDEGYGYSPWNVTAGFDACYIALMRNSTDVIVFQTEWIDANRVTITWKRRTPTVVNHCAGVSDPSTNVDCWLSQNPNVARALIWEPRLSYGKPVAVPWMLWSQQQKADLRNNVDTYKRVLAGTLAADPDALVDPPVNREPLADDDRGFAVLLTTDAWRLYVKTVAMSLAVELTQYVPWTVKDSLIDDGNHSRVLSSLFDSRHMMSFTWPERVPAPSLFISRVEGYQLVSNTYDLSSGTFHPMSAFTTATTPDKALRFLRDNQLIGASTSETVSRTIQWATRLRHADRVGATKDFQNTWQYRGPAPVSATIDGTVDAAFAARSNDQRRYHWTAGCWGTSEFLHAVLRMINIPVDDGSGDGHSHTHFLTERQYLSHADDLYRLDPSLPAWTALISFDTMRRWFVDASPERALANLGRGPADAEITYLSNLLVQAYCTDPQPNVDHAHSRVLETLGSSLVPKVYTVNDLENLPPSPFPWDADLPPSLWDRLALRVAPWGSCQQAQWYWLGPQVDQDCPSTIPAPERQATCPNRNSNP